MKSLNAWLSWSKQRRHAQTALDHVPPKDLERDVNQQLLHHSIGERTAHPVQEEPDHDQNSKCWRLLHWPYAFPNNTLSSKQNTSSSSAFKNIIPSRLITKKPPASKIHPLSSSLIRARNHVSAGVSVVDTASTSTTAPRDWTTGIASLRYPEPALQSRPPRSKSPLEAETVAHCPHDIKDHTSTNLLSVWPPIGKIGGRGGGPEPPHDDLRSILTTQTSWKWFYSSASIIEKFLREVGCLLKQKEGIELGEYRTLLMKGGLDYNRLRHYPNPVLRIFVFLLRDQEAPMSARKKTLIDLCMNWRCKNKNYWCSCEQSTNSGTSSEGLKLELHGKEEETIQKQKQSKRCWEKDNVCHESEEIVVENENFTQFIPLSCQTEDQEWQDEEEMEPLVGNVEDEEYDAVEAKVGKDSSKPICSCSICSLNEQFCYGCMCFTCKSVIRPGEECRAIKCVSCAHLCHLKCALKVSVAGFVPQKGLDGQFLCQCCGLKQDLKGFWMDRLHKACNSDDVHTVEKNLYSAMVAFKDTKRERYKDVQTLVVEAWSQIVNGGRVADVQSLVQLICAEIQDGSGLSSESDLNVDTLKDVEERANICAKKAKEDQAECTEALEEVESWKGILQQAQLQLQRVQMKLASKRQFALLSRSAAITAQKRLIFYSKRLCSSKPMCQTE